MEPRIRTLTIQGFRSLRHLKIDGLGRVNLLTGRNNTGKSSVLEALYLLGSSASREVISQILRYREEDVGESEEATRSLGSEGSPITNLFTGFPSVGDIGSPIRILASGSGNPRGISLSIEQFFEQLDADGAVRLVPLQPGLLPDAESIPVMVVKSEMGRRVVPLAYFRRLRNFPDDRAEDPISPCMFVSPYGSEHTSSLGTLWDKVVLSDREKEVVGALGIISPDVQAVSMIGGERARSPRTAVAKSSMIPHPVPLRSFGDGLTRLFGIALSLVNAKGGLLLIDEVENGLHHAVLLDIWRAIFRLASSLDVQVFATSHSWDSVQSFQKAAAEHHEDGVLVRLLRKGDDIVPAIFREDELAIATRDHIEVR